MGKPFRKPRPSPPHWHWWDSDGCWWCQNRNNCNQCKTLKRVQAEQQAKQKRKEKQHLHELREDLLL